MLQPKRVRYRKSMRGRRAGPASGGDYMAFGEYGLQAQGTAWIAARQIEAARRAMTNQMRRGGKIWIRIFPDKPVSKKPLEVRMGSGKGATEFWVAVVKRNRIIFEVAGVSEEMAKEALRRAAHKLPVPTKIVERDELVV